MGDETRTLQRFLDRGGDTGDGAVSERRVKQFSAQAMRDKNLFRREVAPRRIVLVQAVDTNTIHRGAGRPGQGGAKGQVATVADAHPVQSAQDYRPFAGKQNDAACAEGIDNFLGRHDQRIT